MVLSQIPNNNPVLKGRRENYYEAPKSSESPEPPKFTKVAPESLELPKPLEELPKEDPTMVGQGDTPDQIVHIIAQVTFDMSWTRVVVGETTYYVQKPYKADINLDTPDGLKLYLKVVLAKEKDEEQIKIPNSN